MRPPVARPAPESSGDPSPRRAPQAFAPEVVPTAPETVEVFSDLPDLPAEAAALPIGRMRWPARLLWAPAGCWYRWGWRWLPSG